MFDGNKIGFLVAVLNAIRLDFGWKRVKMHKSALKIRAYTYALHAILHSLFHEIRSNIQVYMPK